MKTYKVTRKRLRDIIRFSEENIRPKIKADGICIPTNIFLISKNVCLEVIEDE